MTRLKQKSQFSQPVSWLSYSKNCEIQQKKAFSPTYGNLFAYGANNPVHYIDPDGKFVNSLLCKQKQNTGNNTYAQVGSYLTYNENDESNTLGNFGCLFVATVNIGNSHNKAHNPNYTERFSSEFSINDSYFDFGKETCFRSFGIFPCDFNTNDNQLEKLLFDMTGTVFSVESYDGNAKNLMLNLVKNNSDKGAYLIGEVITPAGNRHYINIIGFDSNGNMEYFDPYQYKGNSPKYTQNDLLSIKVICEKE